MLLWLYLRTQKFIYIRFILGTGRGDVEVILFFRLPVNDTWIIAGTDNAQEVRDALDRASMSGACTSEIISLLDTVAMSSPESIRVPGTYPHDEWQGTRIEGFVVSQGQSITAALIKDLHVSTTGFSYSKP